MISFNFTTNNTVFNITIKKFRIKLNRSFAYYVFVHMCFIGLLIGHKMCIRYCITGILHHLPTSMTTDHGGTATLSKYITKFYIATFIL